MLSICCCILSTACVIGAWGRWALGIYALKAQAASRKKTVSRPRLVSLQVAGAAATDILLVARRNHRRSSRRRRRERIWGPGAGAGALYTRDKQSWCRASRRAQCLSG